MGRIYKTDLKVGWETNKARSWGDLRGLSLQWGSFKLFDIKAEAEAGIQNSLVKTAKRAIFILDDHVDFTGVKRSFNKVIWSNELELNFFGLSSSGDYLGRMRNYLPWYEKDDDVFITILRAYDLILRQLETGRDFVEMNLFTTSMVEEVLTIWERDFGIRVEKDWSLSERQEMVRARWIYQFGQLTDKKLEEIISSFTNGKCRLVKDYANAVLTVDFVGTVGRPGNLDGINDLLNIILPGVWTWEFKIHYSGWDEFTKKYRWQDLKPFEWLSLRTWDDKKKEKVRLRQEELDEANS